MKSLALPWDLPIGLSDLAQVVKVINQTEAYAEHLTSYVIDNFRSLIGVKLGSDLTRDRRSSIDKEFEKPVYSFARPERESTTFNRGVYVRRSIREEDALVEDPGELCIEVYGEFRCSRPLCSFLRHTVVYVIGYTQKDVLAALRPSYQCSKFYTTEEVRKAMFQRRELQKQVATIEAEFPFLYNFSYGNLL